MDRPLHPITALRRMRLCLLVPLLLVLSQHGAWLHELSHAAYSATAHQVLVRQAERSFEGGVCSSCQSFGQLGSALTSAHSAFIFRCAHLHPPAELQYSQPSAQLPVPRNRGPPHLA